MKFSTVSPCKLNLFLYITGKRPDGYHNLQTLFVILDHGDIMHFETTDDDRVELLTDFGFPVEKNLIYKAAMLLKEQTLCKKGVKISIDKVLPQGGGLGGGSGNAATTLMVLNRLWDLKLKEDSLLKMGILPKVLERSLKKRATLKNTILWQLLSARCLLQNCLALRP